MDKNMDGSVSKHEFLQVLKYFHYYIDESELEKLMVRYVRMRLTIICFYDWYKWNS